MNPTYALRPPETEYQREMRKFKVQIPKWLLIVLSCTIIAMFVGLVAIPSAKWVWNSMFNAPRAWYRYNGGIEPLGELVMVEIDGKKILAKDLTAQQKKAALDYEVVWVGFTKKVELKSGK